MTIPFKVKNFNLNFVTLTKKNSFLKCKHKQSQGLEICGNCENIIIVMKQNFIFREKSEIL